ncbi:MAG: isocitrate dehydrogenase [Elusimicrobia bacterium HGW-Elusimicrobia-1]|jgi:isocitrate dehydrogenase (NAD+)|nr:MAG: isocitrate dehydrogenase [Elusimicrobia bacterium HGW-Elusimicrobia-1]
MKTHKITLIPGDGTGPDIVEVVQKVVAATGVSVDWEVAEAGADVMPKYGTPLPPQVLESIRRNKVALKGPITTPVGTGFRSVNVALRKELDLYACLRPCKLYPGIKAPHAGVDLVVVRENTEDLYAGIEYAAGSPEAEALVEKHKGKIHPASAISIKPISALASERIVKFAFDYAVKHNRKKVTAVAKANIMKFTDGLFFEAARKVAAGYPKIEYEERLIDNMCMQLVVKPRLYDVLVLPNLYGDIISDLCAGLVGGLGVAPGGNFGGKIALFEAVHGSAPKYKGMNKVNPIALILSSKMMLEHIGEDVAASRLESAVAVVIAEGKTLTYDMGGSATSSAVGDAVISKLKHA